jgi:hypothetical protein
MAVPSIQEWINQLNPAYFGANTPLYLSQANNLYQLLAGQLAGFDTQEQTLGRQYENNLAQMALQQQRGMRGLQNAMANRGTLRSGMMTRGASDLTSDYNYARSNLVSGHESDLAQIAQNRLNAQAGYNSGLTGLQSQINTEGQNNMIQQAQQQAATANAQAEMARQNQIYGMQQQIGQQQLAQLQQQNQSYSQVPGQQPGYIPVSNPAGGTTPNQPYSVPSGSAVVPPKVPPKQPVIPAAKTYGKY